MSFFRLSFVFPAIFFDASITLINQAFFSSGSMGISPTCFCISGSSTAVDSCPSQKSVRPEKPKSFNALFFPRFCIMLFHLPSPVSGSAHFMVAKALVPIMPIPIFSRTHNGHEVSGVSSPICSSFSDFFLRSSVAVSTFSFASSARPSFQYLKPKYAHIEYHPNFIGVIIFFHAEVIFSAISFVVFSIFSRIFSKGERADCAFF